MPRKQNKKNRGGIIVSAKMFFALSDEKTMPQKPSKKNLKRKLDKLFSEKIRSKGRCEWCGNRETLQACHIITRKILKLRWEEKNALCLCARCHRNAHDKPIVFAEQVKKIKGIEVYKWLIREANNLRPLGIKDLEIIYERISK